MPAFGLEWGPATVIITCATLTIWSILVYGVRLFMRMNINGPLGWDDYACAAGTLVATIYSSNCIVAVRNGFGTAHLINPIMTTTILYFNRMLFVLGLGLGKLSTTFLIMRITKTREHLAVAYGLVSATILWIAVPVLLIAFQCSTPRPWFNLREEGCISSWHLWLGITMTCFTLETALLVAAHYLVWKIKMSLVDKATVIFAFGIRFVIVPPALIRLLHVRDAANSQRLLDDPGFLVLSQIVVHLSILTATIPCSKPFLSVFAIGTLSLRAHAPQAQHGVRSPHTTTNGRHSRSTRSRPRRLSAMRLRLRPDQPHYEAVIEGGLRHNSEQIHSVSNASLQSGITIERSVSVETLELERLLQDLVDDGGSHGADEEHKRTSMLSRVLNTLRLGSKVGKIIG